MKYLDELWHHLQEVHFDDDENDYSDLERLFRLTDEQIAMKCGVAKGELIALEDFKLVLTQTMKQALDSCIAMYRTTDLEKETAEAVMVETFKNSFDLAMQEFDNNSLANIKKRAH